MTLLSDASLLALVAILAVCISAWAISLWLEDVSIVDSLWPLFFLLAGAVYAAPAWPLAPAGWLVLLLLGAWSVRLTLHITLRNLGEDEDPRYRAMREKLEPHFRYKSLYIVFGLQGLLAWLISAPLLFALRDGGAIGVTVTIATLLWLIGFVFEAGGDWQLARYRRHGGSGVLDTGLWRYTRHPNYFGDACIWWSFWLFATAAGAWWTVYAPLLMTFLLLKVSGVALLEKDIGERRPAYAAYVERTSAFFPLPPRRRAGGSK